MKASELREKSVAELREMSDAERKALFDLAIPTLHRSIDGHCIVYRRHDAILHVLKL